MVASFCHVKTPLHQGRVQKPGPPPLYTQGYTGLCQTHTLHPAGAVSCQFRRMELVLSPLHSMSCDYGGSRGNPTQEPRANALPCQEEHSARTPATLGFLFPLKQVQSHDWDSRVNSRYRGHSCGEVGAQRKPHSSLPTPQQQSSGFDTDRAVPRVRG